MEMLDASKKLDSAQVPLVGDSNTSACAAQSPAAVVETMPLAHGTPVETMPASALTSNAHICRVDVADHLEPVPELNVSKSVLLESFNTQISIARPTRPRKRITGSPPDIAKPDFIIANVVPICKQLRIAQPTADERPRQRRKSKIVANDENGFYPQDVLDNLRVELGAEVDDDAFERLLACLLPTKNKMRMTSAAPGPSQLNA